VFLEEIRLTNLLSYGPDTEPLRLRPLNVLIGPNGSGKSNLIEAISLLRTAPKNLGTEVRDGGGIHEWLWKGAQAPTATIDIVAPNHPQPHRMAIRHVLSFAASASRFEITDERIEDVAEMPGSHVGVYFYYRLQQGNPMINVRGPSPGGSGQKRALKREDIDPERSILAQRRDPDLYPEITYLSEQYEQVRIYRDWSFGRYTPPRQPQRPDDRNDELKESFDNLGLVLNRLRRQPDLKRRFLESLNELYPGIDDVYENIDGGSVQVFLQEGAFSLPATRLSDGTLRYLCLLAILFDPQPPPLVCIEEPELGLHPDVMPYVGKLLKEASEHMQLIVTTHSDEMVDALSESADDVIVCEKANGQTRLQRLDSDRLGVWLEHYRLGELWRRGDIGGNRW
ncbi:MAG: AAA family ATPase, partial [Planctomycetaceae bacterium]|nr:AAA family ATPase [Planctomycetaceae bacterium]